MSYLHFLAGTACASIGGLAMAVTHLYDRTEQLKTEFNKQQNLKLEVTHKLDHSNIMEILFSPDIANGIANQVTNQAKNTRK